MTEHKHFKRRVRARAARTGESYAAALRHVRATPMAGENPPGLLRVAAAQSTVREDPRNAEQIRVSGAEIRALMAAASAQGARLMHLPEGALCLAHKRIMGAGLGVADWSDAAWDVLEDELGAIVRLARALRMWTVLGSVHRMGDGRRPHNSLYVISPAGERVARYDERLLSQTKLERLYTPGSAPAVVAVDGVRLGLALGMECHFPEVFLEYERLDVDAVLFSTAGPGAPVNDGRFALETRGHAAANSYPISYATAAQDAPNAPAGVIDDTGRWLARCPPAPTPSVAMAEITACPRGPARTWRRTTRSLPHAGRLAPDDV